MGGRFHSHHKEAECPRDSAAVLRQGGSDHPRGDGLRGGRAARDIAPAAEKAGVILGLEDTISAEDNVRIMERSKSPAVLTYYDVGNSTEGGFDVQKEIRWLGKERICQFHLKDNPH